MRTVLAAIDNSPAARSVIAMAQSLGRVFDAKVEAIHVGEGKNRIAVAAAQAAGLELQTIDGPAVPALVAAAQDDAVATLVVGTRSLPVAGRAIGSTAIDVITSLLKPVVVVPPNSRPVDTLDRVLVPLEGTPATSLAPRALIELGTDANVEIIVLHVHSERTLPAFTDQPQHEAAAWREEFVARYCPWGIGKVTMQVRLGRREEEILRAAAETEADLVALGWAQELAAGRAPVVREVLERGHTPVMLVPLHLASTPSPRKEQPWSRSRSSHASSRTQSSAPGS
jgi:nucleotide-binding universal stress UspA family protein